MSILDNFEVVDGRERRPKRCAVRAMSIERMAETKGIGLGTQDRYVMRAQLGVEFWANRAQYEDALKLARKVMLNRIYGPVQGALHELRFALANEDNEGALMILDEMEKEITE